MEEEAAGTSLRVRALTVADAEACDAIVASLPDHFGDEGGRREAARAVRSGPGLVATVDDQVIGFLTVSRRFDEAAEITWMAVRADHRGRGVGTALLERLRRDLTAEGRRVLLVLTLAEEGEDAGVVDGYNRTRAFYRSRGFVPALTLPDLWPGQPALLLVLPLG